MTTSQPPAPLPRSARALLAAYRDAHELPGDARDRIWEVVGAEDAPEPAFDPLEEVGVDATGHGARATTRTGRRRRGRAHVERRERGASPQHRATRTGQARWLGWGAATLAAAAVLVLAWRLGGTLGERRQAERTPGAAVMQGRGDAPAGRASAVDRGRTTPSEPRSSTEPASSTAPALPPASPAAPSEPSTSKPRTTPVPTTSAAARPGSTDAAADPTSETTEPGSTLAAERELVARAWGALALGETTLALETAAEHARRFPDGLLAPERTAIDAIARCRRGDADGPRRATAFHRAHPRSPLAKRVDEACTAAPGKSTGP